MAGEVGQAEVEHPLPVRGAVAWIRSTIAVVRDPDDRPLYLFAQAEDVTAQRQMLEQLRASEERFRLLVEGVADYAIFMLDPQGRVTTWNTGAERMKGYRADEVVGRHFRVFYPPEAQAAHHPEHELEVAVREGRYEEEGWRIRKDGTAFWANVVITALNDSDRNLAVAGAADPVEVVGGDVVVRADRVRVVQMLSNLLAIAARYGQPPFAIETRPAGAVAEVRVCDAGPGVTQGLEAQLFRKFVRGPGRRDRGTGLGLFIVRELARRQGGDASYERDGDGRTCFCFTLPRES